MRYINQAIAIYLTALILIGSPALSYADAHGNLLKIDKIDQFLEDILRTPPNGYVACEQLFTGRAKFDSCYYGVGYFCEHRNIQDCSLACDNLNGRADETNRCKYGCNAGVLYKC